ncbi:uncharacterized protein L969DRAFT_505082 [Mixia osmundae IAM 14324]|uniref:Cytochrome b561 domain-containing protein n=1 Tax=Mixia osmundae (strain CBS 9802 / IAM 14324 / JCM 22182 / KY 12970) TaxID=764103 RepID=G7E6W8_MIXOS|nr:uncharacterized protein L969DRAFT_505082 [Mixia osmundae IAM 14324]KEI39040.1 hypothetical protein L969DRAFT_505082 [Mixia osmundae IAM 14324]GAA98578.1 hypothetical protein E5Q_05265 [Mixia osmundae IAM 14324]
MSIASLRENGQGAGQDATYGRLVLVHAIFAVIAYVFLIPAGVAVSRFGRRTLGTSWIKGHVAFNGTAALVFAVISFALGVKAVGKIGEVKDVHHKIGVTIFVWLWVQVILGIVFAVMHRTGQRPSTRPWYDYIHMVSGYLLIGLAWAQLWQALTYYGSPVVDYVLLAIAQGLIVIAWIAAEISVKGKSEFISLAGDNGIDSKMEKNNNMEQVAPSTGNYSTISSDTPPKNHLTSQ